MMKVVRMPFERWRQIENLYHAAREDRGALLSADPDLRREVEELLAEDSSAFDRPAWEGAGQLLEEAQPHLNSGSHLGHFKIVALIGEGGMGEVYRARDTVLKRDVAIKVLPSVFAEDSERLKLFQREAEVLASLNHPNVASIYGVEGRGLVMELVEGESPKGPMAFEDAWKIATQLAAGLEYAHERRVVHRDLKPANLKVTPEGRVKILDFGLAKALAPPSTERDPELGSMRSMATQVGMILGTPAYMSPEQVRGKEADRRADIWAFGVLLYELLTGERLFQGANASETMSHVLTQEPDLAKAPVKVRRLLQECLKKDPEERLRDIGDAKRLLESGAEVPRHAENRRHNPWASALAAAFVAAFAVVSYIYLREAPARTLNTTIVPPENTSFAFDPLPSPPALSPDGRRIVFGARGADGKSQLWLRSLDSPAAQPLAGAENAWDPFWSPDSKSVAFFASGKLKRMEVAGGPVLTLADVPNARGGSWSPQGVIVFAPQVNSALERVSAGGGAPSPATTLQGTGDRSHRFPWFLPDGRHFLFEGQTPEGSEGAILRIGSLDSSEVKTVGPASSNAVYSSGYMLYLRQNTLVAQPFDAQRLVAKGEAAPVAGQVRRLSGAGDVGIFSVSNEGLLVYETGAAGASQQLTWFDRGGKPVGTLGDAANFFSIELSPDRKSVAVGGGGPAWDLWIYDVTRGLPTLFAFSPAADYSAVWAPDGRSIVYASNQKGPLDLYRKSSDNTRTEEVLYADGGPKMPTSWSPDGRFLLFWRIDTKTQRDIWVLPLPGGPEGAPSKPFRWLATTFDERDAQFSPDGRWVAYESDESGRYETYVAPFPGPGGRRQISAAGGSRPRWRADGKEVFFVGASGTLMAAEVSAKGGSLEVGAVHRLGVPANPGLAYLYDVSADGQRFLVAAARQQKPAQLTLVENWTALLKKK